MLPTEAAVLRLVVVPAERVDSRILELTESPTGSNMYVDVYFLVVLLLLFAEYVKGVFIQVVGFPKDVLL